MRILAVAIVIFPAVLLQRPQAFCGTGESQATVANKYQAPGKPPEAMVWIPGREFATGAVVNGQGSGEMPMPSNDAEPIHRVRVDGFWMDKTEVTNEQFVKFVAATAYVTVVERAPTKEEFPDAPPKNLVAGSVIFAPPDHEVPLTNYYQWSTYVKGANWRHPTGPPSDIQGKEKYPVVQIAYPDVEAYAKRAGKRLPTEAEFEFAERGGLSGKTYARGDEFRPKGKWMANTFQGNFPSMTAAKMDSPGSPRSPNFHPTDMGFTTRLATSGNGPAIGIGLITTSNSPRPVAWRRIRRGPVHPLIPPSLTNRSESSEEVRSSAPINI
ncbi:MAG TPA: SUMF1/EgtB/PvdO family nonheme iron enzyme, partial [Chthoniobacterales bacterium]